MGGRGRKRKYTVSISVNTRINLSAHACARVGRIPGVRRARARVCIAEPLSFFLPRYVFYKKKSYQQLLKTRQTRYA